MELNTFQQVALRSNKDLFCRTIRTNSEFNVPDSELDIDVPQGMNKIDSLAFMDDYDKHMQYLDAQRGTENVSHGSDDDPSSTD